MFKKNNEKGFTLIELMIVIAIIGILAAVAIPNFISYRNKAYCSSAESDANSIAGAIADYFSIPSNVSVSKNNLGLDANLSGKNTWGLNASDINNIVITVTDGSGRCPDDYQKGVNATNDPRGYWDGSNKYVKILK